MPEANYLENLDDVLQVIVNHLLEGNYVRAFSTTQTLRQSVSNRLEELKRVTA